MPLSRWTGWPCTSGQWPTCFYLIETLWLRAPEMSTPSSLAGMCRFVFLIFPATTPHHFIQFEYHLVMQCFLTALHGSFLLQNFCGSLCPFTCILPPCTKFPKACWSILYSPHWPERSLPYSEHSTDIYWTAYKGTWLFGQNIFYLSMIASWI